jgi:hypothetical protein
MKSGTARNTTTAPQYNNNYITYNIQLPAKSVHSTPASVAALRTTPGSRHLSKKDRFELVQRAQQLEAERPAVKGLQSRLAAEFDVCPTTVYHILKSRDRVESDFREQQSRLISGRTASQSSTSISINTQSLSSDVVLPEELSPAASPLEVSAASARLRMYEAYQPDVQHDADSEVAQNEAKESEVKTEEVLIAEPAVVPTSSPSVPTMLSSAEALAQQVAIMSRFEEIVSEQLDAHNVVTTAEAHKYTEWYATYYGIKTLEGLPWHCTDDWFERFNAVYMDGRFVE